MKREGKVLNDELIFSIEEIQNPFVGSCHGLESDGNFVRHRLPREDDAIWLNIVFGDRLFGRATGDDDASFWEGMHLIRIYQFKMKGQRLEGGRLGKRKTLPEVPRKANGFCVTSIAS